MLFSDLYKGDIFFDDMNYVLLKIMKNGFIWFTGGNSTLLRIRIQFIKGVGLCPGFILRNWSASTNDGMI